MKVELTKLLAKLSEMLARAQVRANSDNETIAAEYEEVAASLERAKEAIEEALGALE